MQKRNRNMNTYICLYLHKISRRIDKKLIEMFICVVTTETGRVGGFSSFLFIYTFIFYLFLNHANVKEGKEGLGKEERKGGRKGAHQGTKEGQGEVEGDLLPASLFSSMCAPDTGTCQ